jgi:hypothetical protein
VSATVQVEAALDLLAGLVLEDGRRWGEAAADFQWQDAQAVMFVGGGDGNQPVFTVRPYGGDRRRLGSLEAVGARVSHDGKRVVYQRGNGQSIASRTISTRRVSTAHTCNV